MNKSLTNKELSILLPKGLKESYDSILESFQKSVEEWRDKNGMDEIRNGHELDKKILDFLIILIDYMSINYNKLNIPLWSKFLSSFPLDFYYGENVDDFNYIYNDDVGDIFLKDINDFDKTISLKKLNIINKKFKKIRRKIN